MITGIVNTMNEALAQIILLAAKTLLQVAPQMVKDLGELFSRENVTTEDIMVHQAKIEAGHYKDHVPETKIPPDQQT